MITQIASIVATIALAAASCGGDAKPPADSGRLQFTTSGRIQFSKTLSAHDAPSGGAACRWRIETEPNAGLKPGASPKIIKRGDYGNAKIKVAKPDTVKVFLVTKGCGRWR